MHFVTSHALSEFETFSLRKMFDRYAVKFRFFSFSAVLQIKSSGTCTSNNIDFIIANVTCILCMPFFKTWLCF